MFVTVHKRPKRQAKQLWERGRRKIVLHDEIESRLHDRGRRKPKLGRCVDLNWHRSLHRSVIHFNTMLRALGVACGSPRLSVTPEGAKSFDGGRPQDELVVEGSGRRPNEWTDPKYPLSKKRNKLPH